MSISQLKKALELPREYLIKYYQLRTEYDLKTIQEMVGLVVQMKNNIDKKAVGRRIKQIRINKGYTLEAFGKLFGARKGNVQQWENGISLPNKDRIYNISKIANLTIDELLYGNVEKDIQELYEQIIKLPKDDVKTLLTNVVNYLKENEQCR